MRLRRFILVGVLCGLSLVRLGYAQEPCVTTLQSVWTQIKSVSAQQTASVVNTLLDTHYSFDTFAQIALQDHWATWSREQQTTFVSVFHNALRNRLAHAVVGLSKRASFDILRTQRDAQHTTVSINAKDALHTVPIDLIFTSSCQLYDLSLEGALLSRQYRGQFNRVLRLEGFAGLIMKLRQAATQGDAYAQSSTVR